ncbi:hypothetical protein FACS1894219_07200 [Clostridia bacterium]|nr:hypothetical protein FACS1894219_07200 [Clostridia bacterium]
MTDVKTITLKHSTGAYDIIVGEGILAEAGQILRSCQNLARVKQVTAVRDDIVCGLYGDALDESLKRSGFNVTSQFMFPHGEEHKTLSTVSDIYSHLTHSEVDRKGCLIALGGGVTGDITGFAAASYMRGIKFVQIPTTLLAQVDASVGGKTGVDLPEGKNLVGAFKQPEAVICDVRLLDTLSDELYADGMAEVIKHAVIADAEMFVMLHDKSVSRRCAKNDGNRIRY